MTLSISGVDIGVSVDEFFDHSFDGKSHRQHQRGSPVMHLRVHLRRPVSQKNLSITVFATAVDTSSLHSSTQYRQCIVVSLSVKVKKVETER